MLIRRSMISPLSDLITVTDSNRFQLFPDLRGELKPVAVHSGRVSGRCVICGGRKGRLAEALAPRAALTIVQLGNSDLRCE